MTSVYSSQIFKYYWHFVLEKNYNIELISFLLLQRILNNVQFSTTPIAEGLCLFLEEIWRILLLKGLPRAQFVNLSLKDPGALELSLDWRDFRVLKSYWEGKLKRRHVNASSASGLTHLLSVHMNKDQLKNCRIFEGK